MAWIESHETLRDHPKTKRAAKLLNISVAGVVGHLHLLWWWCLNYAQDGDLSRFDSLDVAEAAGWEDDPDFFVDSLVTCGPGGSVGFLERVGGGLLVHDWDEYAGRLIERRQADAERKRRSRSAPAKVVRRTSAGHPADGAQTAHVPNQPNTTVPNTTQPDDDDARAREAIPPAERPPDERTDDTPARRQVAEAYAKLVGRNPAQLSGADLKAIEAGLERTGGDPRPLLRSIDEIRKTRAETGQTGKVGSFRYVLRAWENGAGTEVAAARASPGPPAIKSKTRKYDSLIRG